MTTLFELFRFCAKSGIDSREMISTIIKQSKDWTENTVAGIIKLNNYNGFPPIVSADLAAFCRNTPGLVEIAENAFSRD